MQTPPTWLIPLSSAGYGVIFSLAVVGAIRITGALTGTPVSNDFTNTAFGLCALLLVPTLTYFRFASLFTRPALRA